MRLILPTTIMPGKTYTGDGVGTGNCLACFIKARDHYTIVWPSNLDHHETQRLRSNQCDQSYKDRKLY